MVRYFIYSLIAIALALSAVYYFDLTSDPGYLLLAWRNYTFETSLFALLVLLLLYIGWRLLALFLGWLNPLQLVRFGREFRDRNRNRSRTVEGLLHFARSNWQSAYNQLMRGVRDKDASLVNYLAAAYAAGSLGQTAQWNDCLDQALRRYPHSASTINTVRAGLLLRTGQLEQCAAVLEQLRKNALNDAHLLGMLKEVYVRLEDWASLRELLPVLVANQAIVPEEQERMEKRLFAAEIQQLAETVRAEPKSAHKAVQTFRKQWKKLAASYREDDKLVVFVITALLTAGEKSEAARVAEASLGRHWSKELIALYGATDFGDSAQQLVHGEIWLKEHPRDEQLLLALGRICLRNRLWGKARDYFEACVKVAPLAEAHGELGRLTAALGDLAASQKHFNLYMELSSRSLPRLPLPGA